MKKLIVILCVFVILIGVGVYFILPSNINWDKYVQEMAQDVKNRTGLTLTIQGKPVFSMKPSPVLKLEQVRLSNLQGGAYPQMMTAVRADILFDAGSLFRRKIKVKKVTLSSPQFYFETLPNGKWNWQAAFFDRAGADATIGFDSLLLTDGAAEIKADKYTPAQNWNRINAELFADSIQGPFFFEGNFGAMTSSFGFSLKAEKFAPGQSPDFSLRLINAPAEASFVFTGKYGLSETDRGMLTGGLTFDIRKPGQFFALLYPQDRLPDEVFQPIVGNLKLSENAQTRTSELTDVLFKYGNSSATGKLTIRSLSPEEASKLQAKQEEDEFEDEIVLRDPSNPSEIVTLDDTPVVQTRLAEHLLPKVINGSFIFSKLDADPFFDNASKIAAFFARTEYFEKTQDTYAVDVTFDVVNYKKDVIHQLKTRIASAPDGVAFNNFSATLPSNAYLTGSGTLSLKKKPVFSGKAALEADNINAVLTWLGISIPKETPQNLLRQFKGETEFNLAENAVSLQKIKAVVDKVSFSGGFALRLGNRKAFGLAGSFSELDIAHYFPEKSKAYALKREEFSKLPSEEKIKTLFSSLAFLNDTDLNINLKANTFSFADINANNVEANFTVIRGVMTIKDLSAQKLFASTINVSGKVEGFGGEPKFEELNLKVNAEQLSSLLKELGVTLPRELTTQDRMVLSAKITGTLPSMQFSIDADWKTSSLYLNGFSRESGPDSVEWNVEVKARHENFRNFVRLFSEKYRPALANPGALTLSGRVFKDKKIFSLTGMIAHIGDNVFRGSIQSKDENGIPSVEVEVTGDVLAPLGMLPRMNFMEVVSVTTPALEAQETFKKAGLLTNFADALTFSQKPFDFSFLGKYNATITLKANKLVLNSFVLSDLDSVIKLSPEKVVVDVRRALWEEANFGGIATLTPVAEALTMQTALRISNMTIPVKLFNSDTLNISDVEGLILTLNITGNGKSMQDLVGSVSGTGPILFEKGFLDGFNYAQVRQDVYLLPGLSQDTLVSQALTGRTELQRFAGDVSIKDGLFAIRPASFVYDGGENQSPYFVYNYTERSLTAGVSFPLGMSSLPDFTLSVEKRTGQPASLTQNITMIADMMVQVKNKQKEMVLERAEEQRRQEMETLEKQKKERLDRLTKLDERLTLASAELSKKIAAVEPLAQRVYQVEKYLIPLKQVSEKLVELTAEIQKMKTAAVLEEEAINELAEKAQSGFFNKEEEINAGYNSAQIIGTKGIIFDLLNQANEILRFEAKMKTTHTDLPEISLHTDEIIKQIETMKGIQKKSEIEDIQLEELVVLRAEEETVLDKIKEIRQKTDALIAQKNAQIEAQEKAKREIEEMKKRAEEEAKKAAEALEKAEKAKKEAEQRERQRTIFRTGAASTPSSSKTGGTGVLQSLTPQKKEDVSAKPESAEESKPMIIRRR